ncbi:hemolymph lipopolysaccharide-binding protein-like [Periplaneta americana]|uniref:hemolymph lipopolysaccharide-binding protein-like n=1 Tax=Periplaneta americana TaxID=6978 RepID=UPI0037E915DE
MYRYLLTLFMLFFCYIGHSFALECVSSDYKSLKFSLSSRRNSTGHWIAQVKLGHGAGSNDSGPWEVDIDHTIAKCEGQDSIMVVATVAAPSFTFKPPRGLGYDLVPGFGYYKLHTDVKTWHEALKACEQEGAHLAIINSEAEAKSLTPFWDMNPKILDGGANDWAHVGFHDQYKEGQYLTIYNQSLVAAGYVKWYPGEPHGAGSNCGCVIRRENLLADIICTAKQPFFCEIEL